VRTAIRRFDVAAKWMWATIVVLIFASLLGYLGVPDGVVDLVRLIGSGFTAVASVQSIRAYKAKEEAGA
jgi:hypothetical protein